MAKKVDRTKIERIRDASVEVISEHGILGGSVASIAERADVSVGYLYRHYPGKTELINDLLENARYAFTDRIRALIRETDDIERIVGGIVGFLIESAADNPAKHKFLIMLLNDFSVEIKPESRKRIIEIGEVLLETGQKNRTVRGDISVNDLYIALVGIPMQYLASRYRFDFDSRPCDTQELIRKITRVSLSAIRESKTVITGQYEAINLMVAGDLYGGGRHRAAETGSDVRSGARNDDDPQSRARSHLLREGNRRKGTQGRLWATIAQSIRNGRLYLYGR